MITDLPNTKREEIDFKLMPVSLKRKKHDSEEW